MPDVNDTPLNSAPVTIDHFNPYFISSSDNPNSVLVTTVFNGTGFNSWKRSMIISLSAKNKLGFVDGSIDKPVLTSLDYPNWHRANSMVISWILNSLSRDLADGVLFLQTASEIWSELNQRFEQSSDALLYQIQQQLYSISQGSESFSSYFTKLTKIWDELRNVQNFPTCSCATGTQIHKFLEEQRLIQLLMGLNDSYKILRGQILMMKPLPSISTAYSLIIQEEQQRGVSNNSPNLTDSIVMNASVDHKKSVVCTNCKKLGHSKAQCYRIIGFPQNFKFTKTKKEEPKINANVVSTVKDYGITEEQYQNLLQMFIATNFSSSSSSNVQANSAAKLQSMDDEGNPFSFKHFAMNVYESSHLLQPYYSWIIDSGATDHMCSNRSLFLTFHKLHQSQLIGLPDGHDTSVDFYGDIRLHDSITLQNVLYVPRFKYNLVSVSKLSSQLQTFLLFTDQRCLMQDPSMKSEIALGILGNRVNDLYVFDHRVIKSNLFFSFSVFNHSVNNYNLNFTKNSNVSLWHNRLGHTSI